MSVLGDTAYVAQAAPPRSLIMFVGLVLALFMAALDQSVLNTAVPALSRELNGLERGSWVITAYLLTSTLVTPFAGRSADLFGVKKMLVLATLFFTVASIFCGSAGLIPEIFGMDGMYQLVAARAIQGIGGGGVLALCFVSLAKLFDARERGKYQGLLAAGFTFAALVGPVLGGYLSDNNLWRFIFYMNVPIGIAAIFCLQVFFPDIDKQNAEDIAANPADAHWYRNKLIFISLYTVFVTGVALFGGALMLAFLLQQVLGFNGAMSGLVLTPLMIVVAVTSVGGGMLLSKTGRYKNICNVSLGLMALGSALMSTINAASPLWLVFVFSCIGGIGLGMLLPIQVIVIQNVVPQSVVGFATSLTQFCRLLGGTFGTGLMTILLAILLKQVSMQTAISFLYLLYAVSVVVTLFLNLSYVEVPLKKAATKLMILVVALICSQSAANASAIYENQSDVGHKLNIPVHKWSDPNAPVKGVILAIPGLVFNGRAYDSMARHLVEQGFVVYSADMRGYGDWRDPNHTFDGDTAVHFTQTKEDLTNVLGILRESFHDKPVYCMGESFGANYAVWLASTHGHLMDGLIASGLPYRVYMNIRPRWIIAAYQGFRHPKTPRDLTPYLEPILTEDCRKTRERLTNANDTLISMSPTDLVKAAITKNWALKEVPKIPADLPILMVAGGKDRISKIDKLPEIVPRMGSKQVKLVVLPRRGHLLLEERKLDPQVVELVDAWLAQQTASSTVSMGFGAPAPGMP